MKFSQMNALDIALCVRDIVNALDAAGVIVVGTDGHAGFPPASATLFVNVGPAVEKILTDHGVEVPAQAQTIINALPLILQMAGIK